MSTLSIEGLHPVFLGITGDMDVFQGSPPVPFLLNPNPNNVIQSTQAWGLSIQFKQTGLMTTLIDTASTWRGQLLLEEIGPGEFAGFSAGLGSFSINHVQTNGHTYNPTIPCPPGSVPVGVYTLHFFMQLYGPAGNPQAIVAQSKYGTVTIYNP